MDSNAQLIMIGKYCYIIIWLLSEREKNNIINYLIKNILKYYSKSIDNIE